MLEPTLLRDRPRHLQIVLAVVVPAIAGCVAGVLIGVSSTAYYAFGALAGIGAVLAGFEHLDGWGGADRGLLGGFSYGVALLVMHAIVGTEATVSLGSFPPFLAVITAIAGMLLSALGGSLGRRSRERAHPPSVEGEGQVEHQS